jgi:hypothetical protein
MSYMSVYRRLTAQIPLVDVGTTGCGLIEALGAVLDGVSEIVVSAGHPRRPEIDAIAAEAGAAVVVRTAGPATTRRLR